MAALDAAGGDFAQLAAVTVVASSADPRRTASSRVRPEQPLDVKARRLGSANSAAVGWRP
jgi:hypothetical protein